MRSREGPVGCFTDPLSLLDRKCERIVMTIDQSWRNSRLDWTGRVKRLLEEDTREVSQSTRAESAGGAEGGMHLQQLPPVVGRGSPRDITPTPMPNTHEYIVMWQKELCRCD